MRIEEGEGVMVKVKIDENSFSLQRINNKCIDCGACLQTCEECNHLENEDCINCGQCILTCPMGALQPKYNYKEVLANIHDEEKIVVVSVAPAVRVTIGDEFGFLPGEFLEIKLVGALKALGFDYVFDVTFGADLTIMEEASELVKRIKENKNIPMFTSCCPSWVNFMEKYHPEDLNYLSTCKSPIGMQGAMIKYYFAHLKNLNPEDVVVVTIAPCVSKKSEIKKDRNQDTDYILTTSELAMLFREQEIDMKNIKEAEFDSLLGHGSGAGVIFGTSGGVMEAAMRTAYYLLNHKEAPESLLQFTSVGGKESFKEAEVDLGVVKVKVAVLHGLHTVQQMYSLLKNYHFVEVMTCPSGCVGGGGQTILPKQKQAMYIDARSKSLYQEDEKNLKRCSYENEDIKEIYANFLEKSLSDKAEKYLHTSYKDSSIYLKMKE